MFRRTLLPFALLLLLAALPLLGAAQRLPQAPQLRPAEREYRAVWLCTLGGMDWPGRLYAQTPHKASLQRRALCQTLDRLQAAGINTILFQTRIRATVAYASKFEPWDGAFSGTPGVAPPYDVLQFAVEEAHRRGMELHAYLVAYPICSQTQARQLGRDALPLRRPDLCVKCGDRWMMDPGAPGTAEYLAALCREIVEGYDVDGIHLDYIRYPEREIAFSDARTYARYGNGQPKAAWRRDNVTRTVRLIHRTVRSVRPWVKLSCSPIGKYADLPRQGSRGWNARDAVSQDVRQWMREGLMDVIFPMMYFDNEHFYPFLFDWQQNAYRRPVVPGLGIYFLSPSEGNWELAQVRRQLNVARQQRTGGQAFFRSRFLLDDHQGILPLVTDFYRQPALTPPMTWLDSIPPAAPRFSTRIVGDALDIRWEAVSDATPVVYNLYRLEASGPQLVAHHLRSTQHLLRPALPARLHDTYVVVAMDAYGNESPIPTPHAQRPAPPRHLPYPAAHRAVGTAHRR